MLSRTTTRDSHLPDAVLRRSGEPGAAGRRLPRRDGREELIQGLSFPAYRCVATFLRIPQPRGQSDRHHSVPIDPEELETALARDLASYTEAKERREAVIMKGNAHEKS